MNGATLVIGTAGHVDHGKTSLVRMLTGVDLDDLAEEKERGITIALGFAWMDLPDGRRVAFVDVPGHEKLVRTMIAGASGLDAALLCVSALEGVMPQTREHLAILQILGVQTGIVVLTFADLADPDLLELVTAEVEDLVAGTTLRGCPILAVGSPDGRGREALVDALSSLSAPERAADGPFSMPIDRVFTLPGFGTVVTGTVQAGRLSEGTVVTLAPGTRAARARSLQVHGQRVPEVRAGWRAAVNLAGIEVADVPRGAALVVGRPISTSMLDVELSILADAPVLPDGSPVRVLIGTAEGVGRLHLVSGYEDIQPDTKILGQLRLDEPIYGRPGDRCVVRRLSPAKTLGGGVVLDPWAPKLRAKARSAHEQELLALRDGDRSVLSLRAGEAGLSLEDAEARGAVGVEVGGRVFHPAVVARLEGALREAIEQFHAENPLLPGAGRRELRRGRLGHLAERTYDELLNRLIHQGTLSESGGAVWLHGFQVRTDAGQDREKQRILGAFTQAGPEGLGARELGGVSTHPDVERLVRLLEREGALVAVPGIGWIEASSVAAVVTKTRSWFLEHPSLAPPDFKAMTGLSRKAAIPLLEWLDREGYTRRDGDRRLAGPRLV